MENKLSVILSAAAIFVSIFSATIAYQLQQSDSQRAARDQLSKTVTELVNLNAKYNSGWYIAPEKRDATYNAIPQLAASITRQAVFLVNSDPTMVTDVDFVAIAQGLAMVGDNLLADAYFQNAISKSPSDFYRISNLRLYAYFLFTQGKHELAREKYQEALKLLNNDTDFNKVTNGYTYLEWMDSEFYHGFPSEAELYYQRAVTLFGSISGQTMRLSNLNTLNRARKAHSAKRPN